MSVAAETSRRSVPGAIQSVFDVCAREGRSAFIPFATAGYPDLETSYDLLETLVQSGADILEIGVPFSDPLADGPTVQHASQIALERGTTLSDALGLSRRLRDGGYNTPIVLMGYANPFLRFGPDRLAREAAESGVNGFIVPDLPLEECAEFRDPFQGNGLDLIFMVAPTTTEDRLELMAQLASGFIYCVSLTGTTGARKSLSNALPDYLSRVRATTDLPLAVGFGISTPSQVSQVSKVADGVIVASAILNLYDDNIENRPMEAVREFVRNLAAATRRTT